MNTLTQYLLRISFTTLMPNFDDIIHNIRTQNSLFRSVRPGDSTLRLIGVAIMRVTFCDIHYSLLTQSSHPVDTSHQGVVPPDTVWSYHVTLHVVPPHLSHHIQPLIFSRNRLRDSL